MRRLVGAVGIEPTTLGLDRQRCQLASVDASHYIFVSNRLQVDHRGRQVFVTHPILQGLDVAHVILQVPRRKGVPELVQIEIGTIRTFRALVAVP